MNVLLAENVSKSFGERTLFQHITFGIDLGQKVALIARNGAGKSSLLNIINGEDQPDEGKVTFRNDLRVGYLHQNPSFEDHLSVLEVLFDSKNEHLKAIKTYEFALFELNREDSPRNHKDFEEAMSVMDRLNAWDYESKVREILGRFDIHQLDQKVGTLSGGQKKKLAMAKVLVEETDLLILDEPTNHLDIEMIEWLENYLSKEKLSLLLVTHDRYFLDTVCDTILELENGNLYRYQGNYAYYLEKKAEREYNESAELEKNRNLYYRELEWIHRSPQARTTKARARIGAFYELEEKISKRAAKKPASLHVKAERVGKKILEINNIDKAYGNLVLLKDFSHTFKKEEKAGIVGRNGAGKTTLLDILAEKILPDRGRIVKGQSVTFGYYSQEGMQPSADKRIIEIVKEVAEVIPLGKGRDMSASQFLFHFGFNYDTQYNYFYNLSGGERRKLYLLMTLIRNPNFLLLDEPTNDLDIFTLNVLEDFLRNFEGCVLFVSHDRFFIDKISDHVFIFEGQGKIKDYWGSYSEYRRQKDKLDQARKRKLSLERPKAEPLKHKLPKQGLTYKEQKEYEKLESDITAMEAEKASILEKLNKGDIHHEDINRLSNRFAEIDSLLDEKMSRWLELDELNQHTGQK